MALLFRKRYILAKIETTYDTDAVPTEALNAILVSSLELTPMDIEYASRDLVRPFLGNFEQLVGANSVRCVIEVEIAGAGAAGTAPKYGPLLRACGLSETISAGVSVTYAPVSQNFESLTFYVNMDGILHKFAGSRGNVALSFTAKQIPRYRFEFVGTFRPVVSQAQLPVSYSGFVTPLAVNKLNTPVYNLHSYTPCMESVSIDFANAISYRELVNCQSVELTDRRPTAQIVIEEPTLAEKDYFSAVTSGVLAPMNIQHGTVAGNIVAVSTPSVQLTNPTFSELDGIVMLNLNGNIEPTGTGNNEISIVVR